MSYLTSALIRLKPLYVSYWNHYDEVIPIGGAIPFRTKIADEWGMWDGTTLTAPKSCLWFVNSHIRVATPTVNQIFALRVDGQDYAGNPRARSPNVKFSGQSFVACGKTLQVVTLNQEIMAVPTPELHFIEILGFERY